MWLEPFKFKMKIPGLRKKTMNEIYEEWETDPFRELMFKQIAQKNDEFYFAQKKNINEIYDEFIKQRVLKQKNLIINIESPPGEGKSRVGLKITQTWIDAFKTYLKQDKQVFFTFNAAQSQMKLPELQDGDIILQDEDTKLIGSGSTTALAELQNLIETMRYTQKSIIICAPHITPLAGVVTYFRTMGYFKTEEKDEYKTRILVYQLLEDKPGSTQKFTLLGYLEIDVGSIEQSLLEKYTKAKDENYRKIEKNMGGVNSQSQKNLEQINQLALKIFPVAIADGWPENEDQPSKKALTKYLWQFEVALHSKQEDVLRQEIVKLFHAQRRKREQEAQLRTKQALEKAQSEGIFKVEEMQLLEEIKTKANTITKQEQVAKEIEIYLGSKDPLKTGNDYAKKYGITPQRVSQLLQSIKGKINDLKGKKYEGFFYPYLQAYYKTVVHDGGVGKPDFYCEALTGQIVFYSVKCYEIDRHSYSIPYEEAKPEIEAARKLYKETGKLPIIIQHIYNLFNQKIYEFEIDFTVIEKTIPFSNRNHTVKLEHFTRDPIVEGWIPGIKSLTPEQEEKVK